MPSHEHAGLRHVWLDDLQAKIVARLESNPAQVQAAAHLEHGSPQRYWNGCRCDPCRVGNALERRDQDAQRGDW
ncbi:hypothetical protein [Rathayibacter sp. VKM Ac-2801]|uniref:hypothetical protein n=1 Tax=Rathayibacter sp. VKM Ac-2801 TaxID=2609255 RepID=UPI00131F84E6|nr:hypothetical protein [Rathayibacter sp. VKM Ac-2801]QHC71031.1 hypothetical protein GSU45_12055 [Rathayibacter sp. VKM Ac-2801]